MKFIELFAGIGGFRYGLERAGDFKCVWSNDIDKYACQVYRYRFGNQSSGRCARDGLSRGYDLRFTRDSTNTICQCGEQQQGECIDNCVKRGDGWWHEPSKLYEGDIRAVDPASIPDHDLIVGGFPCQSFSIAGKRGGFEDTRGTLFFEICRIARAKRTKYLFLENVKGLLNHNQGKTFETIIRTLDELGYDCEWQVLNSKFHGVPQNRERVFIIANLRGERRPQVFPIGEADSTYSESNGWGSQTTPTGYNLRPSNRYSQPTSRDARLNPTPDEDLASCLDANYGKGWLDHGQRTMVHTAYQGEVREYSNLSPTISTPSGGGHLPMVRDGRDNRSCLRSGQTPGIGYIGQSIRRLTPVECERLQGFPDNWTKYGIMNGKQVEISDSQRYKCCGNAVTTNVITEIGKRIIK